MPVLHGDRLYAVLDIDADVKDYWEDVDTEWLRRFASLVH
jgi:putative methionine-R-sulfoxide reductase with GAF domain